MSGFGRSVRVGMLEGQAGATAGSSRPWRADAVLLLTSDSVVDDVIRLDITGNVVSCEEGCPIQNGVPDCSTGSC